MKLNISFNKNISTCKPFKDTLIELKISHSKYINQNKLLTDNGLKNCHKIQILYACNNKNITTCEPFKNSLIELHTFYKCGITDNGLKNCHKLKFYMHTITQT